MMFHGQRRSARRRGKTIQQGSVTEQRAAAQSPALHRLRQSTPSMPRLRKPRSRVPSRAGWDARLGCCNTAKTSLQRRRETLQQHFQFSGHAGREVGAFPFQVARTPATSSSRPTTTTAIQARMPEPGTATRKMNVPQMMILSTNGSRNAPEVRDLPVFASPVAVEPIGSGSHDEHESAGQEVFELD